MRVKNESTGVAAQATGSTEFPPFRASDTLPLRWEEGEVFRDPAAVSL